MDNVKAELIYKARRVLREDAFYEVVIWRVPQPVPGSGHPFKYRMALIIGGVCVMRYDNERGKGDHRHIEGREEPVRFTTMNAVFEAFLADVERILR